MIYYVYSKAAGSKGSNSNHVCYYSDVSRTRNGGIPQLLQLLAHNVNLYAPTNTNHFKHWRTFGNLLHNIAMIKE